MRHWRLIVLGAVHGNEVTGYAHCWHRTTIFWTCTRFRENAIVKMLAHLGLLSGEKPEPVHEKRGKAPA